MIAFRLILVLACAAGLQAADIQLTDGRVYKDARIVSMGKETATVLHRDGSDTVALGFFDLELLARAHIELEAKAAQRQKIEAAVAEKQRGRDAQRKAEEAEKAALAQAFAGANAVEYYGAYDRNAQPAQSGHADVDAVLRQMKQRFPEAARGKHGKIEFEAPARDQWAYYRGMILSANGQSAAKVVEQLEARIATDLKRCGEIVATRRGTESAQAGATSQWLRGTLQPYVAQLKQAL